MSSLFRARLAGLALVFCATSAHAAVFINELHYDDSTMPADVGEMVEVVATAGEDLTSYSIYLYNGAVPTAATLYGAVGGTTVPGGAMKTCGSTQVRIASVSYPSNGLQNGGSDAIALVQGTTVIQFLSYEGTATAAAAPNGPAAGLTSSDIGVVETNSTVPGTSLQLGGSANSYAGFTWTGSATATPGECNNNQTFTPTADVPPTVTGTVPADLATNVLPSANLTVTFSETVAFINPAWYDLSCTVSGTHTGTVSGGPITWTIDPDADFTSSEACTLTIDGSRVVDQDGNPDPMAGNVRVNFDIASDIAPIVVTTTPANNATGVSAITDLTIKFSEPVTATGNWFTISCTSGTHAAVADSGPTTYTINPTIDFALADHCTVTLIAANIVDQDGTPNAMAANYVFAFDVAAGDTAPTVMRTAPVEASASVPWGSDISVFFSEPVTAPAGAFALSCATSGTHTFALSSSGTRFLLNPTGFLGVGEACTVTITAAQVTDLDGTPNAMAQNYVMHFTTQSLATNYYSQIDTSSCAALRTTLHNRIKDHTPYMYSASGTLTTATATWNVLEEADQDPLNAAKVLDIYRNRSYDKVTRRAGSGTPNDGTYYNREHTWPNSHGFNDLDFLDAQGSAYSPYTDTHMLYVSATDFNSNRGNSPYANCPTILGCSEDATDAYAGYGGGTGLYPGNSNWKNANQYEVWNHRKGDASRAVLYMDVRYEGGNAASGQPEPDLIITDNTGLIGTTPSGQVPAVGYMGLKTPLLAWVQADPPDNGELLRNDVIYAYQGNRNPFIDHPEWVNCVFTCDCSAISPAIFSDGFE